MDDKRIAALEEIAAKYFEMVSVKAVGDWELEVLAIPFNVTDSDGQWFDADTDIMEISFNTPLGFYQHGVKQGGVSRNGFEIDEKPIIVGHPVAGSLVKKADGWHLRYILDKAVKVAKDIMEAAKQRMVAVSSDSIAHLARLDIGGKLIQYEKDRAGRIAVWPLAGVSMWEMSAGNARPASRATYAMPAMKAIYREAGLQFPDVEQDTTGDTQALEKAQRRAEIRELQERSKQILNNLRN